MNDDKNKKQPTLITPSSGQPQNNGQTFSPVTPPTSIANSGVLPPTNTPSIPGILPISASPEVNEKKEKLHSILSTIGLLIMAPILAVAINAFIFQSYEVDGPSMQKTLLNKDRLIVNKMGKTWTRVLGADFIPKRGTIIVFKKPNIDSGLSHGTEQKNLIKRVIGIPGDRVIVKEGKITLINQEHPDGYNPDENSSYSSSYLPPTNGNVDVTVPKGEVFVSGDNRGNSLDSRYFGTVKSQDILGSLALRIYPFDSIDHY